MRTAKYVIRIGVVCTVAVAFSAAMASIPHSSERLDATASVTAEGDYLTAMRQVSTKPDRDLLDEGIVYCDTLSQGTGRGEAVLGVMDNGYSDKEAGVLNVEAVRNFCPQRNSK